MSALAGAHEQVGNGQKGIAEAGFHDRTVALIINAGNIFVFFIKFPTKYGIQLLEGKYHCPLQRRTGSPLSDFLHGLRRQGGILNHYQYAPLWLGKRRSLLCLPALNQSYRHGKSRGDIYFLRFHGNFPTVPRLPLPLYCGLHQPSLYPCGR